MRDRLIELLNDYSIDVPIPQYVRDDLATYLVNSGVIVPPVKVGQTVWFVRNLGDKSREKIEETRVEKIVLKSGGLYIKLGCNSMYETSCNSIGKTVFLTREEAEKALKGESNGTIY